MNASKSKPTPPLAVIILAAGKGTRMKSALPKVLHPMAGQSMLWHVVTAAQTLNPAKTVVITGFGADVVEETISSQFPNLTFARQTEQKGTGHAVMQAEKALKGHTGPIVILYGDIMLNIRPDVLPALMKAHTGNEEGLTMLSADTPNPTGFGRLFKNKGMWVNVEEKDCTPEQRKLTTVNPCIYAVEGPLLWKLLAKVNNENAQKEYYLTDIIELAAKAKKQVVVESVPAERAEIGMNTRAEIAQMETLWQHRKRQEMMLAGVTLTDPTTVYFSADTQIAADVSIGQHVIFGPGVKIEAGVNILPFCHIEGAHIKSGARVGPFARLRPTTVVGEDAHIGNFVELKNTQLGSGSKANHLSYVGDASVGKNVNLGAGTITANYNSKTKVKSKTVIGDGASTGSHTVLVAPVTMGNNSATGAATVVRQNVEANALTVTLATNKTKADTQKRAGKK